ncbi:MAG: phosphoribosylanthranilate isomerase [Xanthomonadaceae bacterium]|jgi:phosphoribosylanthranilate isomerase|nr:phosphoribosylanthranilate isomerase [Xanthomonadaceae bacterium]
MRLRTRIKFCGMTRAGDVALAAELGVDMIGLVFAHGSSRRLDVGSARRLRTTVAPLLSVVALFRNNSAEEVREVIRQVRPTLLQFHGEEADGFCAGFDMPYLKAIPMGGLSPDAAAQACRQFPGASGFLFDSHSAGGSGGSGQTFDWSRLPVEIDRPYLLAGGIGPGNVSAAIRAAHPWGVDVSSGIEAVPGIKDAEKMRRFAEEVWRCPASICR